MGQHKARHPVSERRLADAVRPADQPGVRDAAAAIGFEQHLLGLAMAEQHCGLARVRGLGLVSRFGSAHEATSPSAIGAVAGSRRSVITFQTRSATVALGALASISTQRWGSLNAS